MDKAKATHPKLERFYRKLMRIRKQHPALARGQRFPVRSTEPERIFTFAATYRDDAVMVAVNASAEKFDGQVSLPEIFKDDKGKPRLKKLLKSGWLEHSKIDTSLHLPPWGYQIWKIK